MNRVSQRLLLVVLFGSLAMFVAPEMASAYHDAIGVRPDETPFYTEGQKITTTLILSTGNVTFDHRYTNDNGETYYFASFQDTSFEYGRSLPAYNQTLIVPLLTVIQHNYTRLLPAGTWTTTVEVRDGNSAGEILFRQPVNVLVKGAEYNVIERQAIAEEANVDWTRTNVFVSAVTASLGAIGGAAAGSILTYKNMHKLEDRKENSEKARMLEKRMRIISLVIYELMTYRDILKSLLANSIEAQSQSNIFDRQMNHNIEFWSQLKFAARSQADHYTRLSSETKAEVFLADTLTRIEEAYRVYGIFMETVRHQISGPRGYFFNFKAKEVEDIIGLLDETIKIVK